MLLEFLVQDRHFEFDGYHGHIVLAFGFHLAYIRERTQGILHTDGGIKFHFMRTGSRV